MMNYLWLILILFSIISSFFTGSVKGASDSFFDAATAAVSLCIKLSGTLCLWGGIMEIIEKSGLSRYISLFMKPVIKRLFPHSKDDKGIMSQVSMNLTANLLGLGNAATQPGIEAVRRMQQKAQNKDVATDEMMTFIVMNTAALRLIPTTVAAMRHAAGAAAPMDIILCVWLSTIMSQLAALGAVKLYLRFFKRKI